MFYSKNSKRFFPSLSKNRNIEKPPVNSRGFAKVQHRRRHDETADGNTRRCKEGFNRVILINFFISNSPANSSNDIRDSGQLSVLDFTLRKMHIKRGKSSDHVCRVCDGIMVLTTVASHSEDQGYQRIRGRVQRIHLLPYSTASQSHKTAKIASIMPQTHLVVEVLTSGEVLGCPDEVLVATADPFPVAIPSVSITDFDARCCERGMLAD